MFVVSLAKRTYKLIYVFFIYRAAGLNFGSGFVLAEGKNQLQTQNILERLNCIETGDHDLREKKFIHSELIDIVHCKVVCL